MTDLAAIAVDSAQADSGSCDCPGTSIATIQVETVEALNRMTQHQATAGHERTGISPKSDASYQHHPQLSRLRNCAFFESLTYEGKAMLNLRMRSPFLPGSLLIGIPSFLIVL